MIRHVHADLMIAYANNPSLKIEWRVQDGDSWASTKTPSFAPQYQYRIPPMEKVLYSNIYAAGPGTGHNSLVLAREKAFTDSLGILKIVYEDNNVKSVEIVK